jgi:hypothetical protein
VVYRENFFYLHADIHVFNFNFWLLSHLRKLRCGYIDDILSVQLSRSEYFTALPHTTPLSDVSVACASKVLMTALLASLVIGDFFHNVNRKFHGNPLFFYDLCVCVCGGGGLF